jgi:hypothetical protein
VSRARFSSRASPTPRAPAHRQRSRPVTTAATPPVSQP